MLMKDASDVYDMSFGGPLELNYHITIRFVDDWKTHISRISSLNRQYRNVD